LLRQFDVALFLFLLKLLSPLEAIFDLRRYVQLQNNDKFEITLARYATSIGSFGNSNAVVPKLVLIVYHL